MSPALLKILLHYYTMASEYPELNPHSATELTRIGFLRRLPVEDSKYEITQCGEAFVKTILNVRTFAFEFDEGR